MDPRICYCFGVSRDTIVAAIRQYDLHTVPEVVDRTHAGMGCRGCWPDIEDVLREVWGAAATAQPPIPPTTPGPDYYGDGPHAEVP